MPETAEKFIQAQELVLDELKAAKEAEERKAAEEEGLEEEEETETAEGEEG